ncbi:MAG: hypothetical protein HRF50_03080 [Phycisphaerae bacterium]
MNFALTSTRTPPSPSRDRRGVGIPAGLHQVAGAPPHAALSHSDGVSPRLLVLLAVIAGPVLAQQPAPDSQPAARSVRVTASGVNRQEAIRQALRSALEQGAGVQIASYSQTENFALVRDTIYSRASGIVSEYKVIEESAEPGGAVRVTIDASVRPDAVAQTWGEIQNILDQRGRPRIVVWIDEKIDGEPQADSIVARRLEELFSKSGFDLVSRQALHDLRRREREHAETTGDAARLAALAKEAGAHIFIRGAANADRAGLEDLYGVPAAFYNCDVQAEVYYADTGKLIASESLPSTRAGVRSRKEHSPQAARLALMQATFPEAPVPGQPAPLGDRLYQAVMEKWSAELSSAGEVQLEVSGLDFKTYLYLRQQLSELEAVEHVAGEFTAGTATYRLRSKVAAQTLAERLTQPPFDKRLEVVDLSPNRIQAKAVSGG